MPERSKAGNRSKPDEKKGNWNIANCITFFRIIVSPAFVPLLVEPKAWKDVVAALLFLLAGFTDFLDGYLARRMDMVTRLGQFLDPLADKIYISVVLIMLFLIGRIGWWVPAVIIGRELIITAFRIYAGFRGVSVPATMLAKLKTNYQVIAIVLVILHFPVDQHYLHEIIAVWLAVAMTIVSGLDYMINVRKFMMAKG